jgi:Phage integrase family
LGHSLNRFSRRLISQQPKGGKCLLSALPHPDKGLNLIIPTEKTKVALQLTEYDIDLDPHYAAAWMMIDVRLSHRRQFQFDQFKMQAVVGDIAATEQIGTFKCQKYHFSPPTSIKLIVQLCRVLLYLHRLGRPNSIFVYPNAIPTLLHVNCIFENGHPSGIVSVPEPHDVAVARVHALDHFWCRLLLLLLLPPTATATATCFLVERETFRAALRHLWQQDGGKLTAFTHGVAVTLIAIASEWVKAPADTIATLKTLRGKLGTLPSGLTDKNQALLRRFDDPRLLSALIGLPDRMWHAARRKLATSRWPFIDLQSALAIDVLLHAPLRMQNLASLTFDANLHWSQGRRKPALVTIRGDETKNDVPLEFEIPTVLADRLQAYRNEIAPAVIGERPNAVFVTFTGKPRTAAAIKVAIERTVLRYLGVKITPHQFRHLAAKISLDANPGAYELVRQLLGHKNLKSTTNSYAGIDTRRAGRAHADLIMKIRETNSGQGRRRRKPRPKED